MDFLDLSGGGGHYAPVANDCRDWRRREYHQSLLVLFGPLPVSIFFDLHLLTNLFSLLYIVNWYYRYTQEGMFDRIAVVAGCVQTVLYMDFFYLYITKGTS